jgi:osmotically-inducible protein OsmY
VPVDALVKAVCQLAEHPNFQHDSAITSAALADKLLETKVSSAFAEHISIDAAPAGITVSVTDGKVTLGGTSSSGDVRDKAEKLAQTIAGVREIDNRIISMPNRG